jgi:hypothetical protein
MSRRLLQADGTQVYDISRARLIQGLRNLHAEWGVYEKCDHDHLETDLGALLIDDVGWTCAKGLTATVCRHCCAQDGGGQSEDCAVYHEHKPGQALCPTMAIVDGREAPWQP